MSVTNDPRFLVTGATGQLGALVIQHLLKTMPADAIVGMARHSKGEAAARLRALGIQVRTADYDRPDLLDRAFAGIERALFISSNAFEGRVTQHRNVVDAAKRAGVALAYTSVLHAETSPLGVAADHRETEALLRASGIPFAVLRNGWYTENYMAAIPAALAHNALIGCAGEGRIASAARADYAAAAAAVLTAAEIWNGQVFELAGDNAYTLAELAAEIARQSGLQVTYKNLSEADHKITLLGAGLPAPLANLLADSDAGAVKGALFDDGRQLSALLGHPTQPMSASVADALGGR